MLIFKKSAELRNYLDQQRKQGHSIGFFPTMGALHNGHLSLLHECRRRSAVSVCSIFVNPTQFTNSSDLLNYPRSEGADILLLEANGCDVLFLPVQSEIYQDEKPFTVNFLGLDSRLEGASRPGHFTGVARIVRLLLDIVEPDIAIFGRKDYQQCLIIQKLVETLGLPAQLVFAETLREDSGLAMSSRNTRLSPSQREAASVIFRALAYARKMAGKLGPDLLCSECVRLIESLPGFKVDYFVIADGNTLLPVHDWSGENLLALTAVFAGEVRLIDNVSIGK